MTLDLSRLDPGRQLRVRRIALGLTQADLATQLGTYPATIATAEGEGRRLAPRDIRTRERITAILAEEERRVYGATAA